MLWFRTALTQLPLGHLYSWRRCNRHCFAVIIFWPSKRANTLARRLSDSNELLCCRGRSRPAGGAVCLLTVSEQQTAIFKEPPTATLLSRGPRFTLLSNRPRFLSSLRGNITQESVATCYRPKRRSSLTVTRQHPICDRFVSGASPKLSPATGHRLRLVADPYANGF